MTLKTVVQEFCGRQKQPVPTTVFGTTDDAVLQIMRLLEEGCIAIARRGAWEGLINEATHVTLNTEDQGAITSIATNGFDYWLPRTFWDRTEKLPLWGPTTPRTWQAYKAIVVTGPRYSIRLRQGKLIVTPAPPAGHTWAFEYKSKNWVKKALDGTYTSRFTSDDDTILLPEDIVAMDLRWRWKKEKGLAYAEDFNAAEAMLVDALGRDGGKPDICTDGRQWQPRPGVVVPDGSWPL